MEHRVERVNLNSLREAQVLPEDKFLKEANQLVEDLIGRVASTVMQNMRAGDYAEIKRHADHGSSSLSDFEKMDRVRLAAQTVADAHIRALGSIYPDFESALRAHGVKVLTPGSTDDALDPNVVKRVFDDKVRVDVFSVVEQVMVLAYQELTTLESRQAEIKREQSRQEHQREMADRAEARRLAAEREHEARRLSADRERDARKEAREQQKATTSPEQKNADECRSNLQKMLTPGQKLTTNDLESWIRNGIRMAKDPESLVRKLKNTGLITYDQGLNTADLDSIRIGSNAPSAFRSIRWTSVGLWTGTLAITAVAVGAGIATGGFGFAAACAVSFLVNGANAGAQAFLKKRFDDKFTNTWKEIHSELGVLDTSRVPALTGVMYLLVDKYSPLILAKNRTKLFLPGKPSSTEAVLDHLKEACCAALNNIAQNTDGYYKGMDVKEKLNLANVGLQNLEQRWKWHFKESDWWATNLTTVSGLGALVGVLRMSSF